MKTVILAGGLGTRLDSLTRNIPKPMLLVDKYPILTHIMETYINYGNVDFIIALGYKGEIIERYFDKYKVFNRKYEIPLNKNSIFKNKFKSINKDKINIELIPTGKKSLTAKRLKLLEKYLIDDENFMLTYGDGLSNVNLNKLINFHKKHKKIATVTAVRPPARFGELFLIKNKVSSFVEKQQMKRGWINGGFFVFNNNIFKEINKNENFMLEKQPINQLVKKSEINAFKHKGFWNCIDTRRDLENLNNFKNSNYPWLKK